MTGEEAHGKVRPLQASVVRVSAVSSPPRLHHRPPQLRATTAWVPPAARPALQPVLPSRMLGDCWGSYSWLSCSSIHAQQRAGQKHQRERGGRGQVVRVGGVAKLPLPPASKQPQLRVASSAQPTRRARPSPLLGPTLAGQWLPLPPPRWQHPAPGASTPLQPPHPGAAEPAAHLSPGAAAPQRVPSPGPSHWWAAPTPPPGHLGLRTTTQAKRTCSILIQAPTEAPPRQLWRTPSSSPPPHPSPALAALPQPPPPLQLALQATSQCILHVLDSWGPWSPQAFINGQCIYYAPPGHWLPHVPIPPWPLQLGHGQVALLFWHSSKRRALGQGTT